MLFKGLNISEESLEILNEEYIEFRNTINQYDEETPYYVYGLFDDDGVPFYVGKGKNMRAFHHTRSIMNNNTADDLKSDIIKYMLEHDFPPIVFIFAGNLSQEDAIKKEGELIEEIGRVGDGGTLSNIMKSGAYFDVDEGVRYKLKLSGTKLYNEGKGIHGASKEQRSEWARIGAESLKLYGNRGGFCSKEWLDKNKEYHKENSVKAGVTSWNNIINDEEKLKKHHEYSTKGGITTSKMVFWTNGVETTRSHECPGEGWYRGNCNVHENSKKNFKKPFWTNGIVNKLSEEKPGDDFFNGVTRKSKNGFIEIIVYKKQDPSNIIPKHLKFGKNKIRSTDE